MFTSSYQYRWPWHLKIAAVAAIVLCIPPLIFYVLGFFGISTPANLSSLGTQGDFFGGHVAAITGSLTLIVVLISAHLQQVFDRTFRLREHFLAGLAIIGQYDVAKPGCEQALRLLDYYALLALELEDNELLILLNTVMTKEIGSRLEELDGQKQPDIYVSARAAKQKIGEVLRDHHIARKNKKRNGSQETPPK